MHEDEEGSPALQLCPNNVRSKTKTSEGLNFRHILNMSSYTGDASKRSFPITPLTEGQ